MRAAMQRADFEFDLPPHLIAKTPAAQRSASRLLRLDGQNGEFRDLQFRDLPSLLEPGDLLVFNDTRVVPARAFGAKPSGGRVEILLERVAGDGRAWVHLRASKAVKPGAEIVLPGAHRARCIERDDDLFLLEFDTEVLDFFERHGRLPLPPYIDREVEPADHERYQTVYARAPGAIAAPTAGLHFDEATFAALEQRGVRRAFVTLHVGAGTFAPVREQDIETHRMHSEYCSVPAETCDAIAAARRAGKRVVAVGTTVVRTLESAALAQANSGQGDGGLAPFSGDTCLFVRPGFRFRVVDAMVTNFHLSGSTLLMLCAAFVGREPLLAAYRHAVAAQYRFFSYGDAMFLTPSAAAKAAAPT